MVRDMGEKSCLLCENADKKRKIEYIPSINSCDDISIKAVYSRSKKAAEEVATQSQDGPEIYHEESSTLGRSLDDLLARDDIKAVIICLPIPVQPSIIKKALAAGKHVLSEKPIADNVDNARQLIEWHGKLAGAPASLWMVAENLRFIEPVTYAASRLKELGGQCVSFSLNLFTFIDDKDKFFQTEWWVVGQKSDLSSWN